MKTEQLEHNENNVVVDLNTTFEESLKKWFYSIAWSEYEWRKRLLCMTKDWQYSFYFAIENGELEMLWNRKEVVEWYTLDQSIEELQWFFSFQHDYFSIYDYKKYELNENDLKDIWKLENLLIEIRKELVKWDINKILD